MNTRRASPAFGNTWQVYYGTRRGIQVSHVGSRSGRSSTVMPVVDRASWSPAGADGRRTHFYPKPPPKPAAKTLGDLGVDLYEKVIATPWRYWWTGGSPTAKDERSKVLAAGSKLSGYYTEGGYIYHFVATTASIRIIKSPSGFKQTVVPKGSGAYNAIRDQIRSGKALRVDATWVKAQKERTRAQVTQAANPRPAQSSDITRDHDAEIADTPVENPADVPILEHLIPYAPYAVGALALVTVGILLLGGRKPRPAARALT